MDSPAPPLLSATAIGLVRLSPAVASLLIVTLPNDPAVASLLVSRLLALVAVIGAWNLTEGAFMVYLRKRENRTEESRGYLIVTLLCGACVLALFAVFRDRASQPLFLVLLSVLSLRGMSRTAWDQKRLRLAVATTFGAHTLLALLSLLCLLDLFRWQEVCVAVAVGCAATAVELAQHREPLSRPEAAWLSAPLYRVSLVAGPLIVATLALMGQLRAQYVLEYAALGAAMMVVQDLRRRSLPLPRGVGGSCGVYGLFVAIMLACRLSTP